MGAPKDKFRRHGVAALASGVAISLTALTAGLSPAVAQPDSDGDVVTTVAPAPEIPQVSAPEPQRPTSAPEPAAPQAPPTQATQAPATQQPQAPAPEPEPAPAPEPAPEPQTQAPQTQAPQTQAPRTSTVVETAEPEPATEEPSTSVERAPSTTTAPSTAPSTRARTTEESDTEETSQSDTEETSDSDPEGTSTRSSAALAPETSTSETDESSTSTSSTETSTTSDESEGKAEGEESAEESSEDSTEESDKPTVSITQAAKELETLVPETLDAPEEDIELARKAEPVFEPEPEPAPEPEIEALKQSIDLSLGLDGTKPSASAKVELENKQERGVELVSNVRQWRPDWIEYDEYYRPVLMNPFRQPVRIVYVYDMRPRILYIPPLARMVIEAAQFAAYSFTAAVLAPVNAAIDLAQAATAVAVGTFFGGGYFPGAGLPLPPPPPPVARFDNVPVFVNYSNARYEPFRVRQIVDVGEDKVYGGRKVLLDGATPVWGEWTQTANGERQFEVRKTQQFPGLSEPAEGPLPGDYRLRLAADESSTGGGMSGRDIFLMVSAGVIGTLGFGAIALAFFLGRRRPEA